MRIRPYLATVLLLTAGNTFAAGVPLEQQFKNWTVSCDNVRRCVATGLNEGVPGLFVQIQRDAGPQGAVKVTIGGDFDQARSQQLRVDSSKLRVSNEDWRWVDGSLQTTRLAAAQEFIDDVRNDDRISIEKQAEGGVSLQGLSAALLLIDDVQGRLDTPGALLRRGKKLEISVPAESARPVVYAVKAPKPLSASDGKRIAAAVRKAQAKLLKKEGCETKPSDFAWALTDSDAVVAIECVLGAYQASYLMFRAPRAAPQRAQRLQLTAPPLQQSGGPQMPTMARYEPESATLSQYSKGRGIGDCGDQTQWVFDGRNFQLAEHRQMPRCGGVDISGWPALWRTRVEAARGKP